MVGCGLLKSVSWFFRAFKVTSAGETKSLSFLSKEEDTVTIACWNGDIMVVSVVRSSIKLFKYLFFFLPVPAKICQAIGLGDF